jgi:hypothetical protein
MPPRRSAAEQRAWLAGDPPVAEVRAAYPQEWARVQRELKDVLAADDVAAIKAYASAVAAPPQVRAGGGVGADQALVHALARQRLAAAALTQMGVSAATGVTGGTLRFGLVSGWLSQRLLFAGGGLERKPVSLRWFRLVWPLVRQKRYLMPLVQPRGIYCFYSRALIVRLADLIDGRPCVEIAAGDGTLARFLREAGVDVVATDDGSWRQTRRAGTAAADVIAQDARSALAERRPAVVLCSWPPAGNAFERDVFTTASVQTYIVIGARDEHAAGAWDAYRAQDAFAFAEDPALSRLVLPPEAAPAVHVFQRRPAETPAP